MPATAMFRLIWQAERRIYELQNSRGESFQAVAREDDAWFDWLASAQSFTFCGKYARLTVRKESRQRGEAYWYAYRRHGHKMSKKYLGRTGDLTLARLEEASRQLLSIAPVTSNPDAEVLNSLQRQAVPSEQVAASAHDSLHPPDTQSFQYALALTTRLHPPRLRSCLVARPHLLALLQQIRTSTLTLVSAPAGSGKTTLLAQWLNESDMPVAWLSLAAQDDEPVRFLSYLIAALQTLDAQLGASARSLLFSPHFGPVTPLETVLIALVNDLEQRLSRDIALVLDDYHVLSARPIQQAMAFLVEHCPSRLHLVLATRTDPLLPLARLRARGHLIEVRAAQLQFATTETSLFLSEVMGLNLSAEEVAALQLRTEGWIAGLHLAALSLQGQSHVSQFLADFTGSHRHIADYLMEEVLARQPEEVQSFLLRTSLLERLCAPLCDVVAERDDSEALLTELERANLFLVPLDERRQWYRYHQLFADLLRARLRRQLGADGVAALYIKASEWYEQNNFPVEAVEAALAAGASERAADLIERLSLTMILRSQHETLRRWVESLPREAWFSRPTLCCEYAIALFIAGTTDAWKAPLQQAELLFRAAGDNRGLGQVSMLRALAASLRGEALEGIRYGQEALTLLPQEALIARSASMSALAEAYRRTGNVKAAWEALGEAQPIDERFSHLFNVAGPAILRARLFVMQGKLRQAVENYCAVLESINERHEFALEALLGLAELLREANELEEASAHLERAKALIQEAGHEMLLARIMLAQARVIQARAGHEDAGQVEAAFAAAVKMARLSGLQSLLIEAEAYRVRWWLAQGKVEAVSRWYVGVATAVHTPADYQQEPLAFTLARVLIAQDEAGRALDLLSDFRECARTQGRTGSEIEILTLMALAYHRQGKSDQAQQVLQQALLRASPQGYVRLFVDEGTSMAVLLRLLLTGRKGRREADYIRHLLALLEADSAGPSSSPRGTTMHEQPVLLEPLSPRERKVLRLLAAGLSNPQIAGELVVSLNTVKTQVQSLYRKLQVSNRQQAIEAARHLQLL